MSLALSKLFHIFLAELSINASTLKIKNKKLIQKIW